jgi:tetratricopeptide (TPR) repeat protein
MCSGCSFPPAGHQDLVSGRPEVDPFASLTLPMQHRWLWLGLLIIIASAGFGWSRWRSASPSPAGVMERQAAILEKAPPNARQAYSRGVEACDAKEYRVAAAALETSAAEIPSCALVHHNLGVAYAGLGRTREALDSFRRALALEPGLADTWLQIGLVHVDEQRYDDAERSLTRALELNDRLEQARLLLSHVWLMRGDIPKAEELARQAVRLQPDSFPAVMALGDILGRSTAPGASAEALEHLRRAAQLSNPQTDPHGLAFRRLGEIALRTNRSPEALRALHHAVRLDRNDPTTWYLLSRAYRASGQAARAASATLRAREVLEWARDAKLLREKIDETPGKAELYFRLGAVEARRGYLEAAVAAYRDGLARNPDDAEARRTLAGLERTRREQAAATQDSSSP